MSDTTIRVDTSVREQLRALAAEDQIPIGDLLTRLAERERYQRDMQQANRVMDELAATDPDGWASYLDELAAWDTTAGDGLPGAAEEWPEYNTPTSGEQVPRAAGR